MVLVPGHSGADTKQYSVQRSGSQVQLRCLLHQDLKQQQEHQNKHRNQSRPGFSLMAMADAYRQKKGRTTMRQAIHHYTLQALTGFLP